MVILGVLIIVLVVAVVIAVLFNGNGPATMGFDWFDIDTTVATVFLTGAASVLLTVLALWFLKVGWKRNSDRRAEMKGLRKKAEVSEKQQPIAQPKPSPSSRPAPSPSSKVIPEASPKPAATAASNGGTPSSSSSGRPVQEGPDEYFDTAPREK